MITIDTDPITARLPSGYRARQFRDSDREPLVEERNSWLHPMERQDAGEWRTWERFAPDETLYRIVVEDPSGGIAAYANLSAGGVIRHADGAQGGGVSVARAHRRRGIGSVLLETIETEARRRSAPRLLSDASEAHPFALEWATKRGFREIGRRIESYLELAGFDRTRFADRVSAVAESGIRLRTFAEVLDGLDDAGREAFYRSLYEAQTPIFEDVPFATPLVNWSYERFRNISFDSGRMLYDCSIVAFEGERIVGFTTTGKRQQQDGLTWITGTARSHRGRGVATALKVEALSRAKTKGLRALSTVNDEPNKAMRGINAKLGYQTLPPRVQLEKTLSQPAR